MKIKETTRYMFREWARPMAIYYGVVVAIELLTRIVSYALDEDVYSASGITTGTAFFLLVVSLNSFKSQFKMLVQNGVSRRTMVAGFLAGALCFSGAMAVIDNAYAALLAGNLRYPSVFSALYASAPDISSFLMSMLWYALCNFTAMCFGYFVTTLYCRMNKPLKLLVSIGVPVTLFVLMPLAEAFVPSFRFFPWAGRTIMWLMGLSLDFSSGVAVYPSRALGSFCVISAALAGVSFLLVRRATIKMES